MNNALAISHPMVQQLKARFSRLYGDAMAELCTQRAIMLIGRYGRLDGPRAERQTSSAWSEKTAVLIAYPNHVTSPPASPLVALNTFVSQRLYDVFDTIHILPFFPSSSDDGFSVVHYRQVDPAHGSWEDIQSLGQRFRLMFDLVLNHVSAQSGWFRDFQLGIAPARHYFIEKQAGEDYSVVVRPRSSPLFSSFSLKEGKRAEVWTTFSSDQVDLNYACPDVLFEMLDIALLYATMGASILRLDAIAYLWKQTGTPCIHLLQTHEIVKVFRAFLDMAAPGTWLLTETNVPHAENVAYFGAGDEAHMVYQFSLPPLVLLAALSGRATHLTKWASELSDPPAGCTFLNFTASHDGIGLRPLERIVPEKEIHELVEAIRQRGGYVSTRRTENGAESPYELNITWFDAVTDPAQPQEKQVARYLATQSVPLILKGVPAVYFSSLFGARNDYALAKQTGHTRSINRSKWAMSDLEQALGDDTRIPAQVWQRYTHMLRTRRTCPAFHPDGAQRILNLDERLFAMERIAPDNQTRVLCITNFADDTVAISRARLAAAAVEPLQFDLLSRQPLPCGDLIVPPYGVIWAAGEPILWAESQRAE